MEGFIIVETKRFAQNLLNLCQFTIPNWLLVRASLE